MELFKTIIKCDIDGAIMDFIHADSIESFLASICFCDSYIIESQTAPDPDEQQRYNEGLKMGFNGFYLSSYALGCITADEVKKESEI